MLFHNGERRFEVAVGDAYIHFRASTNYFQTHSILNYPTSPRHRRILLKGHLLLPYNDLQLPYGGNPTLKGIGYIISDCACCQQVRCASCFTSILYFHDGFPSCYDEFRQIGGNFRKSHCGTSYVSMLPRNNAMGTRTVVWPHVFLGW